MQGKPRRVRRLVSVPAAILLSVGMAAWFVSPYLSFRERFRRSRPALDAYAVRVAASGSTALAKPPPRLGYFAVHGAEPLPHGFVFQSDFGNPFDWNGIAYSTEPLARCEEDAAGKVKRVFTPIERNWYAVFRP